MTDSAAASTTAPKIRRTPGSCDRCYLKKVRCDRAAMGGTCSNCVANNATCTHRRRKGTNQRNKHSIEHLNDGRQLVSCILSTVTVYVPPSDLKESHKTLMDVARYARALEERIALLQVNIVQNAASSPSSDRDSSHPPRSADLGLDSDAPHAYTQGNLLQDENLVRAHPNLSFRFVRSAILNLFPNPQEIPEFAWRRTEVWTPRAWEALLDKPSSAPTQPYIYPEPDLLASLLDLYFTRVRASGMHTTAVREAEHPGTLYQLQLLSLSISFVNATHMGTPDECWILAGLALRFAEAAGLHRSDGEGYQRLLAASSSTSATAQDVARAAELYRRVVWSLLVFDTILSAFHGRPVILDIEEVDLDLPTDAYTEELGEMNLDTEAQNDPGPSRSAYFRAYIGLIKIFRRIKETVQLVDGEAATVEDVVALDSALNQWADTIPVHLRLHGEVGNPIFLDQSTALYVNYYHVQIILHRGFIPGLGSNNVSSKLNVFPSLAICTTAARSCVHVLRLHNQGGSRLLPLMSLTSAIFDAAMVLLVNAAKQRPAMTEEKFTRATADVRTCMDIMRLYERWWRLAGKRYDGIAASLRLYKHALLDAPPSVLTQLTPSPPNIVSTSESSVSSPGSSATAASDPNRQIDALQESLNATQHLFSFSLPLRTEELGVENAQDLAFALPYYQEAPLEAASAGNLMEDLPHLEDAGMSDLEFGTVFERGVRYDVPSASGGRYPVWSAQQQNPLLDEWSYFMSQL
ncbi:Zn(2)-C6 fungal-type domain-containing protein [Mycena kentingensis (nom. inval.)]|nr:Zn(2)-C6 fungal-type domain-containing protein [Mycena kentingensis (nom. inval.)]